MPKRQHVGRGSRTPAKHELLNKVLGRIVGAASTERVGADRFIGYDLSAGDGNPEDDTDFWHGTSPGILIRHAAWAHKRGMARSIVILYEINPNTFARLIDNLTTHLGDPLAAEPGRARYDYTPDDRVAVAVFAFCESGETADLGCVSQSDCVFVCNDPNSIHDWAMRPTLVVEILRRTWMCTTFSTLGCNANGIKRRPYLERKTMWYPHLQAIKNAMSNYTDLVLAAIVRDASQWAYAITVPTANRRTDWRADTETNIHAAFKKIGRDMRVVWWRKSPQAFESLEDELFLTRTERESQNLLDPEES